MKPVSARTGPPVMLIAGVAVLVVALIAIMVYVAVRGDGLDAEGGSNTLPEGAGVSVGPGVDADVPQLTVYEDFQCPVCGQMEDNLGAELVKRAEAGEFNVTFTMMSFLDQNLGNDSSTRAANAAVCAANEDAFTGVHQYLFANQPEEGAGFTDDQLLTAGREAGLTDESYDAYAACVQGDGESNDVTHQEYVEAMQTRANKDGVRGTPTVTVNGEALPEDVAQGIITGTHSVDDIVSSQ